MKKRSANTDIVIVANPQEIIDRPETQALLGDIRLLIESVRKDSGVEWLGKVPKNWDVGNLKWLTNFHNYIRYSNKHIYDLKALMYIKSKVSVLPSGIV